MKTLTLANPIIMMLVGLPGSGKSYFAEKFSETFNIACVSQNHIRRRLAARPLYSKSEDSTVEKLQDYMMSQLVKTKVSFLLDGGCNTRKQRQTIEQFAKENKFRTLVIWVQTSQDFAKNRATKAKQPDYLQLSEAQFDNQAKKFSPPKQEGCVVISGMHNYTTQAKTILRKLAAPHASRAKQIQSASTPQRPTKSPLSGQSRGIIVR